MEMWILPEYHNIVVHNFGKSHFLIENTTHGIYCDHLQRELVYTDEQMNQRWAKPLHDLLRKILRSRNELEALGVTSLSHENG